LSETDRILLEADRKGKQDHISAQLSKEDIAKQSKIKQLSYKISKYREKKLEQLSDNYILLFKKFFATKKTRKLTVFVPLVFLVVSIVVL